MFDITGLHTIKILAIYVSRTWTASLGYGSMVFVTCLLLPQLPKPMTHASNVVISGSKIANCLN
jgi:hypothetical protein